MRSKKQTLSSAAASPWLPVSGRGDAFGIGFGASCGSTWNGTYSIQHTFSDIQNPVAATFAQSTTTVTVTLTDHGLTTSDAVIVSGTRETGVEGQFEVATVTNANVFTYTSGTSQTVAAGAACKVAPVKVYSHDTVAAQTATADGGYDLPCRAVRGIVTTYSAGELTLNWDFLD